MVYGTELLDPLDKPANLLKSVVRLVENIHCFLKENNPLVHKACSDALLQIFDSCFPSKADKVTLSLIFFEPLASIIQGGFDKLAQAASSLCLDSLF